MLPIPDFESNALFRLYSGLHAESERNWAMEDFVGGAMAGGVSAWVVEARITQSDADDLAKKIKLHQVRLLKTALIFNAVCLLGTFAISYATFGLISPEVIATLTVVFLGACVILSKDTRATLRKATAALSAYQTQGTDPGPRDADPASELYEHCQAKNYFSSLEVQAIRLIRVNSQFFGMR